VHTGEEEEERRELSNNHFLIKINEKERDGQKE
jgi:hypothetical protein